MIRAVVQSIPEGEGFRVEAFDRDGADLLPFPSPFFTTAGEAEYHGLAELHRRGFLPGEVFIEHPPR